MSAVTDRRPPWNAVLLASFNRGDGSDRSYNNLTPTNQGNASVSQRVLVLDGGGDSVDYGSTILIPESVAAPFTLMCWYNLTALDTGGWSYLASLKTASTEEMEFIFTNTAGYSNFCWGTPTWGEMRVSLTGYTGAWNHLALAYDGGGKQDTSKWRMYHNGVAQTILTSSPFVSKNYNNMIGRGRTDTDIYDFNGKMDDFRLYSTALTAAEIYSAYIEGTGESRP